LPQYEHHALIEALIATYQRADLIEQAVANTRQQASTQRHDHQAELAKVTADLQATEDAIDRYLTAFEHNTLPEEECGPRVQRLRIRRDELRERQDQLRDLLAATHITAPTSTPWPSCATASAAPCATAPPPPRKPCSKPWSPRSA
jgi:hypothetical protein